MNAATIRQVVFYACAYFVSVFALGFVLGTARVVLLVPALGERWAELSEMPIMLFGIYWISIAIFHHPKMSLRRMPLMVTGAISLALLLAAELLVVLSLRGLTIGEYLESRDPVSGSIYIAMLIVFALMPWFVSAFSLARTDNRSPGYSNGTDEAGRSER